MRILRSLPRMHPKRSILLMKRIPIEYYKEAVKLLDYDPSSPSFLRWRDGRIAGTLDGGGYFIVRVLNRLMKVHRIVWYMHKGTMPDLLDHRDNNPSNNAIDNLREATEEQNRANSKKHSDNTSGVKGISWDKKTQSWIAKCCQNYKQHHVGRFTELDDAKEALIAYRNNLHKEFARHD